MAVSSGRGTFPWPGLLFRWWGARSDERLKALDWALYVGLLVFALNLSDFLLTLPVFEYEANPLLVSITVMAIVKLVVVPIFLAFIVFYREKVVARVGLLVLLVVYLGVNVWHFINVF